MRTNSHIKPTPPLWPTLIAHLVAFGMYLAIIVVIILVLGIWLEPDFPEAGRLLRETARILIEALTP